MPFISLLGGSIRATFRLSLIILLFGPKLVWQLLPLILSLAALWHFREDDAAALIMAALMCAVGVLTQRAGEKLAALVWQPSTSHGSARFATESDVRIANLFSGRGLILGRFAGNLQRACQRQRGDVAPREARTTLKKAVLLCLRHTVNGQSASGALADVGGCWVPLFLSVPQMCLNAKTPRLLGRGVLVRR